MNVNACQQFHLSYVYLSLQIQCELDCAPPPT